MTKTSQGLSPALILLMSVATGLAVASNYYAQPLLDTIARAFNLSASSAGFIVTAAQLGYAAGLLFLVPLGDMFERRMLIVSMTLDFATCMLTESTLSYLGFGIPLPTPTWGNLLNGANNSIVIQQYWWQWVFPAVIFGICTICINLIGDGLRDALDPKALER